MLNIIEQIRNWISLTEAYEAFFTDFQLDLLEQYSVPIIGFIEVLNDPSSSNSDRMLIKRELSILLDDGGFWGETINAHSFGSTDLKRRVESLRDSI
jgi:hypothetical protein